MKKAVKILSIIGGILAIIYCLAPLFYGVMLFFLSPVPFLGGAVAAFFMLFPGVTGGSMDINTNNIGPAVMGVIGYGLLSVVYIVFAVISLVIFVFMLILGIMGLVSSREKTKKGMRIFMIVLLGLLFLFIGQISFFTPLGLYGMVLSIFCNVTILSLLLTAQILGLIVIAREKKQAEELEVQETSIEDIK